MDRVARVGQLSPALLSEARGKLGVCPATNFRLLIKRSSVRPFVSGIQLWIRNCVFREVPVVLHDLLRAGKYITCPALRK